MVEKTRIGNSDTLAGLSLPWHFTQIIKWAVEQFTHILMDSREPTTKHNILDLLQTILMIHKGFNANIHYLVSRLNR